MSSKAVRNGDSKIEGLTYHTHALTVSVSMPITFPCNHIETIDESTP
jgi:hypothetical protein